MEGHARSTLQIPIRTTNHSTLDPRQPRSHLAHTWLTPGSHLAHTWPRSSHDLDHHTWLTTHTISLTSLNCPTRFRFNQVNVTFHSFV